MAVTTIPKTPTRKVDRAARTGAATGAGLVWTLALVCGHGQRVVVAYRKAGPPRRVPCPECGEREEQEAAERAAREARGLPLMGGSGDAPTSQTDVDEIIRARIRLCNAAPALLAACQALLRATRPTCTRRADGTRPCLWCNVDGRVPDDAHEAGCPVTLACAAFAAATGQDGGS